MSHAHGKPGTMNMFEVISDDLISDLQHAIAEYLGNTNEMDISDDSHEPSSAAIIWLSQNFLTKLNDPRKGVTEKERRSAAIVKWLNVEERNRRTNDRIFTSSPAITIAGYGHKGTVGATSYTWDFLLRARSIIARLLGPVPDPVAPFLMEGGFTGGAGTSKRRSVDTIARKYTERLDATPSAANLFDLIDDEAFAGWWTHVPRFEPRLVKGNILFTVPKNAEIDRVACKEPEINLWCQKAVGNHIRDRLRRMTPIDLNNQQINQRLAKDAYFKGLATIDLSSASDSLTTSLCRALLPADWYKLVMALRSPKTFIDGFSHVNEMVSSMGNGFTFELESLVFYALARATYEEVKVIHPSATDCIGVYGDDIIVDRLVARPLIALLGWAGFKVNAKKTFTTGSFYESCGKHYYAGVDVSPFYIRKPFRDVSDLILTLNQLRSWMIRSGVDIMESNAFIVSKGTTKPLFYDIWRKYSQFVPRSLWGGWDLTLRTQLVTLGSSRCRLVPETRAVKRVTKSYSLGMYLARLHWSGSSSDIDHDSLTGPESRDFTSEFPEIETGKWKIRRFDDHSKFFGIATEPLTLEMLQSDVRTRPQRPLGKHKQNRLRDGVRIGNPNTRARGNNPEGSTL